MGIGRVLGAIAPIAAGYFAPASMFGGALGATGSAIATGAATGAGIAALSGQDVLGGAVTGGLGGLSGGSLKSAFAPGVLPNAPTVPTAQLNADALRAATDATGKNLLQSAQNVGIPGDLGSINTSNIIGQGVPSSGFGVNLGNQTAGTLGSSAGNEFLNVGAPGITSTRGIDLSPLSTLSSTPVPQDTSFMAGVDRLGDGNTAMGLGKLGITGLGVAGGAGAFDPEPIKLSDSRDKYDPNARLDLSMDTGIDDYLNRDTSLRLLAQGGRVQKYAEGGTTLNLNTGEQEPLNDTPITKPYTGGMPLNMGTNAFKRAEYTPDQLATLAEYGVVPNYSFGKGSSIRRIPVKGIVDVGGNFVARPDGDITDVEFLEQFKYILDDGKTTAEKNQQSGMDPNLAPSGQEEDSKGLNPGAISALASGFAQQQMNPPTKPQTLGLEPLAKGGRVKGYMGGGIANVAPGGLGNNTRQGGGGGVPGVAPGGLGNDTRNMGMPAGLGNSLGVKVSGGPKAIGTALNLITGNQEPVYAPLGLESLQAGGYLETGGEVGDGMSDEIEATIEGEQEARLSDGEFVVPADVVSHLGNGSSDAGAKRLYEMMDKIRMARTGTKKQGKEINPGRFMPA
jgi:hypothetical protein